MITKFKLFENVNNKLDSWLTAYKPDSDNNQDLINRIQSIMKLSNVEMIISDFEQLLFESSDNDKDCYYVYDTMLEDKVVIHIYEIKTNEYIEAFDLKYDEISNDDIIMLYSFLDERIEKNQIEYGILTFSENIYLYNFPEKEYEKIKPLIEISDWSYKDSTNDDFLDVLDDYYESYSFNDHNILNWKERIIKDFPKKYQEYLKKKEMKRFNI